MRLLMAVVAVCCIAAGASASTEVQEVRTVRLQWTPAGEPEPVEGRVSVEPGRILRVQGWRLQAGDTVGRGWSWRCVGSPGKTRTLLVTLAAPRAATLRVVASNRSFDVALAEVTRGSVIRSAEGTLAADALPTPRPLSQEGECDFPVLAGGPGTGAWAAWIAHDGREDRIALAHLTEKGWETRGFLPRVHGEIQHVALASAGERLVAVWVYKRDGNWDLYAATASGGRWSRPARVTRNEGPDVAPQLATDRAGRVWLAWQSFEGAFSHIRIASWDKDRWSPSLLVTDRPANHWAPAIAAGPGGEVYVAWDSYQTGSYDIYLRSLLADRLSPIRRITDGPEYEANASLAVEPGGRVWIAFDRGEADWGSDRSAPNLHRERHIALRCLEGDRMLQPPLPEIPDGGAAPFAEAPRIHADDRGQVWIAYRRTLREGTWDLVAQRFDGHTWSSPILIPDSPGRSDMRAAFAAGANGALWLAWASDARDTSLLRHSVWITDLPQGFPASDRVVMPPIARAPARGTPTWVPRPRPVSTFERQGYTLYQGDLQRYTELSPCHPFEHGSMLDGIRYALDAAQLDFVGFTLSGTGTGPGEGLRRHLQQQAADVYTIPGRLVALTRIECRTPGGGTGALYGADGTLQESLAARGPDALWQSLLEGEMPDGVLGALCGWSTPKAAPAATPRPGLVAPFEGTGAPSAATLDAATAPEPWWLSPDARSAVVAGTGHGDARLRTHLWAGYLTREAVVHALHGRHSYIGPADVTIRFTAQGKLIGSVVHSGGKPLILLAQVSAGTPVREVQVLLNGRVVETKEGQGESEVEAAVTHEGTSGADYAYSVRVICRDGGECWTTPIWVSDPKV